MNKKLKKYLFIATEKDKQEFFTQAVKSSHQNFKKLTTDYPRSYLRF